MLAQASSGPDTTDPVSAVETVYCRPHRRHPSLKDIYDTPCRISTIAPIHCGINYNDILVGGMIGQNN